MRSEGHVSSKFIPTLNNSINRKQPMNTSRRDFLRYAQITGASVCAPSLAFAQEKWPTSTLRFISSSGPGDPVDLRLREFVEDLGPALGNSTRIVENRMGAGGIIAAQSLLTAQADGNSVLVGNAALAILPTYNKLLPFVPLRDLVPVALNGLSPACLAIPSSSPEKTLEEWVVGIKKRRANINYASSGTAGVAHLYGLQIDKEFSLNAVHIAYKGVNAALFSMMAGDSDYSVYSFFDIANYVKDGKLRVLAVTGDQRSGYLPQVPTFAEAGFPNYERVGWSAYYMKAGTRTTILDKLGDAINSLNSTSKWVRKRAETYSDWRNLSREQISQRLQSDTESWGKLMRRYSVYSQ